jgi:hypothetical protein
MPKQLCLRFARVVLGVILLGSTATLAQSSGGAAVEGRRLLDQVIAALGGPAYQGVKNATTVGRLYEFRTGATTGALMFKDVVEYPDKVRSEFGYKHELVMINNRLQGWVLDKGAVRAQTAEEVVQFLKSQQHDLDRLLRWRLAQEKIEVMPAGKVTVEGTPALRLDLIVTGVETVNLYIDAVTKLPIKFAFTSLMPASPSRSGGGETKRSVAQEIVVPEEIVYSNYHPVAGVNVPFHQLITRNGEKAAEIFYEQVQFNTSLSDGLFANPVPPPRGRR